MEVSKDKLAQLYSKYPQYHLYKTDEFLKVMVEKGELTPEEVELLQQPSLFKFDLKDNCGLQLEHFNQPKYHPDFPDIEVDSKGKIKMEQFEPEKLKAYWEAKDCEVEEDNDSFSGINCIIVYNNEEETATYYTKYNTIDGEKINITKSNSVHSSSMQIDSKTQSIDYYEEYTDAEHNEFSIPTLVKHVDYINNKPAFIQENGTTKIDKEYMNNFIQKFATFEKKRGKSGSANIKEILSEIPLAFKNVFLEQHKRATGKTLPDATTYYPDLQEVVKDFSNDAKVFKATPQELAHYIENELSKDNPDVQFLQKCLRDINKLLSGIEEYNKIQQDKLEQRNSFIDKISNFKYFKPKEEFNFLQKSDTVKDLINNILSSKIDESDKYWTVNIFLEKLTGCLPLQLGYTENSSEELNKFLETTNWNDVINKIYDDKYTDDIKNDMLSNSKNGQNLIVDIKRLINRSYGHKNETDIEHNGKIDNTYTQGYTGDCWLIAGITSILNKEGGKEYLESLLDYDKKTGNIKVNLKGVNKTYVITAEEIKNSKHLAKGDFDIRAFEIAIDKYMRDNSYDNNNIIDFNSTIMPHIDIDGNWNSAAFELLIGKATPQKQYGKDIYKEFNNKNKVFVCSAPTKIESNDISYEKIKIECVDNNESNNLSSPHQEGFVWPSRSTDNSPVNYSEGFFWQPHLTDNSPSEYILRPKPEKCIYELDNGFKDKHAYSIVGSDEKNIFIKNPWYPDITLKISIEDFEKLNPFIGCADFKQN